MTTTIKRPSESSVNYLTDLVKKRQVSKTGGNDVTKDLADLTRWLAGPRSQRDVSDMIDRIKTRPVRPVVAAAAASVPARFTRPYPSVPTSVPDSKFAILTELLTEVPDSWRKQEYLFFEVKKLRGRRVIRRLTGAPGRFNRTALPAAAAEELLNHLENQAIAYQAAITFAEIYKVCGRCAAELTDTQSRERRLGPICWNLMETWRNAAIATATTS